MKAILAEYRARPPPVRRRDFTRAGGLMSYDPDILDGYRQIGIYTGKILKGALPADVPIQQPTKFQLVINLKTAARSAQLSRRRMSLFLALD